MSGAFGAMFLGLFFVYFTLPLLIGIAIIVIDAVRCAKGNLGLTITSIILNIIVSILLVAMLAECLVTMSDGGPLFLFLFPIATSIASIICASISLGMKASASEHSAKK